MSVVEKREKIFQPEIDPQPSAELCRLYGKAANTAVPRTGLLRVRVSVADALRRLEGYGLT
jgi:hypothetical protein